MPIDRAHAHAKLEEFAVLALPVYPELLPGQIRVLIVERVESGYDFKAGLMTAENFGTLPGCNRTGEQVLAKLRAYTGLTICCIYFDGNECLDDVLAFNLISPGASA